MVPTRRTIQSLCLALAACEGELATAEGAAASVADAGVSGDAWGRVDAHPGAGGSEAREGAAGGSAAPGGSAGSGGDAADAGPSRGGTDAVDAGAADSAVGGAVSPPDPPEMAPALPDCECFVRASWCGAGAAETGLSRDTPCRVPLSPEHDDDLLGCRDGAWVVLEACEFGCFAAPPGTPDTCNPDPNGPTPENPGWEPCPRRDLLAWGLHPEASDRLRCAGIVADDVTQTIGNAAASAGYHAEDGRVGGEPYCAAVDLRSRDLTNAEIRALLVRLGENGFAAWYRWPGHDGWPGDEAPHIHAVFAGVRMKAALRGQIDDFLIGRNGLASHGHYDFWEAPQRILDMIRLLSSRLD